MCSKVAEANDTVSGVNLTNSEALSLWLEALSDSVRSEGPDLTARQTAILLTVYLTPQPHTVRGLAAKFNIAKPVVTRAIDALSRLGLVKRKRDESDRRNVLIQRTVKGSVFLSDFSDLIVGASKRA